MTIFYGLLCLAFNVAMLTVAVCYMAKIIKTSMDSMADKLADAAKHAGERKIDESENIKRNQRIESVEPLVDPSDFIKMMNNIK
jgi:hypothetical protein